MTLFTAVRRRGLWSLAGVTGSLLAVGVALPAHAATVGQERPGIVAPAAPMDFVNVGENGNSTTTVIVWLNTDNGGYHAMVSDTGSGPLWVDLLDDKTGATLARATGNGPGTVNTDEVVTGDPVSACGQGSTGEFCTPLTS